MFIFFLSEKKMQEDAACCQTETRQPTWHDEKERDRIRTPHCEIHETKRKSNPTNKTKSTKKTRQTHTGRIWLNPLESPAAWLDRSWSRVLCFSQFFPALIPSSLLWTATRNRAATDLYSHPATNFRTPIYESASHVALTFRSAATANKLSSSYPPIQR